MCGIFGVITSEVESVTHSTIKTLALNSRSRGRDASGLAVMMPRQMVIHKSHEDIKALFNKLDLTGSTGIFGHSRLVTNGSDDNQPITKSGCILFHNGIVTNCDELWENREGRKYEIDSEIIIDLYLEAKKQSVDSVDYLFKNIEGVVSACLLDQKENLLILISNNGSLYYHESGGDLCFASEEAPLKKLGYQNIYQLKGVKSFTLELANCEVTIKEHKPLKIKFINKFKDEDKENSKLFYSSHNLKRCKKCILPETMPFIIFDEDGICNYCNHYKIKNDPKPLSQLADLVQPYRKKGHVDCIVPFSGGRDSCMALHLIKNELGLNPVTYTYDWGMVTDLGRRNISRFCAKLGVENIIVAADIRAKRRNIRSNLNAWLKKPHLGMLSLLTAGDKQFFKYVEKIKKDTGVSLNIWGINPLEVTHFKAGFLGVAPNFMNSDVYISGWRKQINYQIKRYQQYIRNPRYFNVSIFDTLEGEYWRSVHNKSDYYHLFDYYKWDEVEIDSVLDSYNWERAVDTKTSWRIGDGTAAFYNYVYYTVAGFTEHDTFRSNQIREGQLSRDEALSLVTEENKPRYQNIQWYLDSVGIDYETAIQIINKIPKIYPV